MIEPTEQPKRRPGRGSPRFLAGGALLAVFCLWLAGCSKPIDPWKDAHGKRIMTSFAPIYCFVATVAGDDATVHCLLTTTGPHEYRPAIKDSHQLRGADLFFINGLGIDDKDDMAKRLVDNSGNKNLRLVDLGKCPGLKDKLLPAAKDDDDDPKEKGGHHHHDHGDTDPHMWLGIPQAIAMVQCIRDELVKADPEHQEGYKKRAAEFIVKLEKLGADGNKALADKKDRNIVAFHDSLQYFARTFNLKIVASIEGMAGAEPDPGHFKEVLKACKRDNVRVIAVEPQYPRNTAATALLTELKAKGMPDVVFAEVDPIETVEPEDLTPTYYEKKMRENIENLAKALK
jgi:ABC-type Zn uptake system ZnuABC Zn-binding protein ZnuA